MMSDQAIEADVKLGLGTWGLAGEGAISGAKYGWTKLDPKIAIETIREAFDLGIRFFDTADFYGLGLAEELLAKALPADSDIVLASKGGMFVSQSAEPQVMKSFESTYIENAVHASLKRLRRDYIDVYQLHGPSKEILSNHSVWEILEKLVTDGKIGAFGVAVSGSLVTSTLCDWAAVDGLSWLQVPYSFAVPDLVAHVEKSEFLKSQEVKLIGRSLFHHGILLHRDPSKKCYGSSDFRSVVATSSFTNQVAEFWASTGVSDDMLGSCLGLALTSNILDIALVGASSPSQIRQLVLSANAAKFLSSGDRSRLLSEAKSVF